MRSFAKTREPTGPRNIAAHLIVLCVMRRITGAAALASVVLAAIESMELLGMPPLGASDAAIETAYADTALGVVTVTAGALSLLCYVAFAAALRDATGVFFACCLGPGSLAAFAGGVYVGSAAVYAVALRAPRARPMAWWWRRPCCRSRCWRARSRISRLRGRTAAG
jgi:hypothetical protein